MSGPALRPLAPPLPPAYQEFTYPYFRPLLDGAAAPGPAVVAVGLTADGVPAGLGLARLDAGTGDAQVLSLAVAPACRGRGWGTQLLAATIAALRAHGARAAGVTYTCNDHTPAFEAVLRKCGWVEPRARMILCKTDAAHIRQAPWMQVTRLAAGFEIFAWRDLPAGERRRIRERESTPGWHPPILSPFSEEARCDWASSVGLSHRGEVAGWMITHRVISGSLRYTSLFVREDFRRKAPHLPLLAEAIRRHLASPDYAAVPCGMFNWSADNAAMQRFFGRRLRPYLIWAKESRGAWKRLE